MKQTSLTITIAILALFASCQTENQIDLLESPTIEQEADKVPAPEITATQDSLTPTKSLLEVDGEGVGTIYWTPADEINVFYGTTSTHYVSQNASNATTAVFRTTDIIGTTEGVSENIWGLYPYNESATCTGTAVTTTLPSTQYGVPGTFDDDLFITLAHNTSTALTFYNVCGGIKFSLSRDDITSITFRGNNNEDIAGNIILNFVDGLPAVSVTSGVKAITLTPKEGSTFIVGEDYYIVLLPSTLSSGFNMTFTTLGGPIGTFNYSEKAVTIKRSVFGKKADIDTYAEFVSSRTIRYTSTDGDIVTPYSASAFGATIISNEYSDGMGTITFDADITSIGNGAFYNRSKILTVVVPNGVTSIGTGAFQDCTGLTSIELPEGLTAIGSYAFSGCSNLPAITVPSTLSTIGANAFYGCKAISSLYISDLAAWCAISFGDRYSCPFQQREYSADVRNLYLNDSLVNVLSIPSSVTSIGMAAFSNCTSITTVSIPASVTSIGDYAFYYNKNLSSISISVGVTEIGAYVFSHCGKLSSISIPEGVERIDDSAFSECSMLSSVTLPESLQWIDQWAFWGCESLESIDIPDAVSTIGANAFSHCSSLGTITLSSALSSIEDYAFAQCYNLKGVSLPYGLKTVGRLAFNQCTSLKSITIPSTVITINNAFKNCSGLTEITVLPTLPPTGASGMFDSSAPIIYVPSASLATYKGATYWSAYADRIQAIVD